MFKIKKIILLFLFCLFPFLFWQCYSFTGASIHPEVKTISVKNFRNIASTVNPSLAPDLTDILRQKFQSQTSLNVVQDNGDMRFEGNITSYTAQPTAIQSDDKAALYRLRVTVSVKFVNIKEPHYNFDETFDAYRDYDAATNLSSVEDQLVKEITDELADKIFNKAVANW